MGKKENITKAATYLFASQGFDGTTTIQLSEEAGVTEPLIYYHFSGKDELYTTVLQTAYDEYFNRLNSLKGKTATQFERIENIIALHIDLVQNLPHEMLLMVTPSPGKLVDPENVFQKNSARRKKWLTSYFSTSLRKGVKTGEFKKVPVSETSLVLLMIIDEILYRRHLNLKAAKKKAEAIIDFCRRSLVAG
jgi:AcrR family transcriptional regulator